jgi:hypothetical protein
MIKQETIRVSSRLNKYVIAMISLFLFTHCSTLSRFPEPFNISTYPAFEVVDQEGIYVVEASCPDGTQLLGGGYSMPDGDNTMRIGVTASYPSSSNKWRVIFEIFDNENLDDFERYILGASAHCLTTDDFPVNTTVVSSSGGQGQGTAPFSIETSCPAESVLTGGGFQTDISGPNFATFNANIFASAPTMGENGQANGWQVALSYMPQDNIPETSVYAICARQNLTAGPLVVNELDVTSLPTGWGWSEVEATCPQNMFTTGGGYSIMGDLLIPRQVSMSNAQDEYEDWKNIAAFGYQAPNYDFRPCDPQQNPDCAKTAALAACVVIPDIRRVSVEIIEPDNGQGFVPFEDTNETIPITFEVEARDENGDPLTGEALEWFRDGTLFGTGETVTARMPAPRDRQITIVIRVVATGLSSEASDQINISSGMIQ